MAKRRSKSRRVEFMGEVAQFDRPHYRKWNGHCDPPGRKPRRVRVAASLEGRKELEIILHEFAHFGFWIADEDHVKRWARDMAKFLDDYGYRRTDQP